MNIRENPWALVPARLLCVVIAGSALAWGSAPAQAQANNTPGQDQPQTTDPFAVAPPAVRTLPSILERDAEGKVVSLDGDPARRAIQVMRLSATERRDLNAILRERDAQLLRAAIPNTDKIVQSLEAWRNGNEMEYDAFGRGVMGSLGQFGRRGAFVVDAQVRQKLGRGAYGDLNTIVREYNLARVAQEREKMLEQAGSEEIAEVMLRDSTILQRLQQRDVLADAARMLKRQYGGDQALIEAHPELEETIRTQGYWAAMSTLSDTQLERFVFDRTQLEVRFPSPEGEEALAALARQEQERAEQAQPEPQAGPQPEPEQEAKPQQPSGNAGRPRVTAQSDVVPDADGVFRFTDEELEVLRVQPGEGPSILRRGPDGRAVRLRRAGYLEAYDLMASNGSLGDAEMDRLDALLEDRARVFDEQTLRLYEYLVKAASYGPIEEGPLEQAVLNKDWNYWGTMFGAWLNEKLPAPSTFHNDLRVRNAMEWDSLVELARIANIYDGGHIFDARIELLKMVRDDDTMDDATVALPGNIKRPWRLQQIIRDAKASYARQLRVTEPDFRGVLASLELEPEVEAELKDVVAADGPMTEADFWAVAIKLPPSAHRELIEKRTGYEAPEPGFFEGKIPVPTTGEPEN